MTLLTHITPRFLPQIDGLGDYARLLGATLKERFDLDSRFVVGDPRWTGPSTAPFLVTTVRARKMNDLFQEIDSAETLVLHYVCYGYDLRGTPFWINRAIRRWKEQKKGGRLIVVFHELWAAGPPWKSEFYLGPFQRHLVTELHNLCDAAMTSTPVMFRMLERILPGKTSFQPIPSNFPTITLNQRKIHQGGPVRVIVLGQEASRLQAVLRHQKLLRALHHQELITGVDVMGRGATDGDNPSADVRLLHSIFPKEFVTVAANVSPEQGTSSLAQADLFLSYYPSAVLCKSGALMAAMGCGCVPILPEADNAWPLKEGREILACDGSDGQVLEIAKQIRSPGLGSLAQAGWDWYNRNASWPEVVRKVAQLLRLLPAIPATEVV